VLIEKKEVFNKLSIVVTDGDSQEITQLQEAAKQFFPMYTAYYVPGTSLAEGGTRM
jgi:hypothetical protein